MKKQFCTQCGTEIPKGETVCPSCGKKPVTTGHGESVTEQSGSAEKGNYHYSYSYNYTPPENKSLPFSCHLAYIPFLFWIPLVTDRKNDVHRHSANQGLWITLLTIVFTALMVPIIPLMADTGVLSWNLILRVFTDWSAGWQINLRTLALLLLVIMPCTLTVPMNGLFGFLFNTYNRPYHIPGVGRIQLIKTQKR